MTNNLTFEQLYNSACGVVGIAFCDTQEEFDTTFNELEQNPDFTYLGQYDTTQDIDDELENQGFTLDDITKMSLNRYGRCLEVIEFESNFEYKYHAFIGNR